MPTPITKEQHEIFARHVTELCVQNRMLPPEIAVVDNLLLLKFRHYEAAQQFNNALGDRGFAHLPSLENKNVLFCSPRRLPAINERIEQGTLNEATSAGKLGDLHGLWQNMLDRMPFIN